MNKNSRYFSKLLIILFIIIFVYIILFNAYINNTYYQEGFVPKKMKEFYRPVARNVRVQYEGFYNKSSTSISNFLRKFGIL